ncbi:MAG: 2-amino-4-hydroxy-6-hydroxymethyldihydropteridine diphosphokinase [Acidobacteria bacterium]|nr:2-amino-4-hydroxy-6-hydroxymethyldihydropteridine diphosphokinase [Acidobacteriota bacterium]
MTRTTKTAYLALGSNQGDREKHIERALEALTAAGIAVRRSSPLYETQPVGTAAQRWFLNCVLEVETELMPLALLRATQRIERQLGRRPAAAPQPVARTIDIDILFYGTSVVRLAELTIPHPRLAERRFVLAPLCDLAPELRHPLTRKTATEMLAGLTDRATVRRWSRQRRGWPAKQRPQV